MTSKRSLVNPTLFTFKNALKSSALAPAFALFAGLMFSVVALGSASLFQTYTTEDGAIEINSVNFKYLFFEMPQIYSVALPILVAGAGGLMGVLLFKFITSKKTVNVYYSLGIKREKLFWGNYLAGAILLSLAIIIPFTVMFFVNLSACGYSAELLNAFVYITASFLAIALTAFSVTSAVFGAVGTAFETTLFSAIVLFLPTILFYALQTLMDKFLFGNPYGNYFVFSNDSSYSVNAEALTDTFSFLNPVFFNSKSLALYSVMDDEGKRNIRLETENLIEGAPDFLIPALWLLAAAVIAFLSVRIFQKRKAEICGFIGMNKYLNTISVFTASFFAFCFAINLFPFNAVTNALISSVIFAVLYIGLELLVLRDVKKFKNGIWKLPCELALCGIAVIVFATGLFGYSQRLPEAQSIKEAAITFGGVNEEFGYSSEESYYFPSGVSYATNGLIVGGFTSEKDIQAVLEAHKAIADAGEYENGADIKIIYTLKNGKTFKRRYDNVSPECYEKLLSLEKSEAYKKRLYEVYKGEIKEPDRSSSKSQIKLYEIQNAIRNSEATAEAVSIHLNETAELNLTKENRDRLVNCLYNDLLKRTVEEKYHPEKTPPVYLEFNYYGYFDGVVYQISDYEEDEEKPKGEITYFDSFDAQLFNLSEWDNRVTVAITEDMESTIRFLKDIGVYERLTKIPEYTKAEVIDEAEYSPDEYYFSDFSHSRFFRARYMCEEYSDSVSSQEKLFSGSRVITNKEQINELAQSAFGVYQCDKGEGEFVAFYQENGSVTVMYIPENSLK